MNRFLFSAFIIFISAEVSVAQLVPPGREKNPDSAVIHSADTLIQKDTTGNKDSLQFLLPKDSITQKVPKDSIINFSWMELLKKDSSMILGQPNTIPVQKQFWQIINRNPYFGFSAPPVKTFRPDIRQVNGKELLFYLLILLLLVYAFLRKAFPKYFNDLFRLFFRTTLNQTQIREQLMETPLPSLLLNVFFVISASLYISFLVQYYDQNPFGSFWLMFFYCLPALSAIYFFKFIGIKFSGWLFNMQDTANSYIFIIFVINKMIGIFLLPFLIMLAFTPGKIFSAGLTLSWCMIAGLFIYRVILTFGAVRNQVKVNPFHFFLYICAFEIAPLLLIYKGLLLFFRITA